MLLHPNTRLSFGVSLLLGPLGWLPMILGIDRTNVLSSLCLRTSGLSLCIYVSFLAQLIICTCPYSYGVLGAIALFYTSSSQGSTLQMPNSALPPLGLLVEQLLVDARGRPSTPIRSCPRILKRVKWMYLAWDQLLVIQCQVWVLLGASLPLSSDPLLVHQMNITYPSGHSR
jgi:hypothetical protein